MKSPSDISSSPSPFRNEEEVFYKVVRLKTGEAILCSMNDDVRSAVQVPFLVLMNPVMATSTKQITKNDDIVGELFMMRPWIGLSDSKEFTLTTDIVLTIGNLKPAAQKQYIAYLDETLKAEKHFKKLEEEHKKKVDEEKRDIAIYELLKENNGGREVFITRIHDDPNGDT